MHPDLDHHRLAKAASKCSFAPAQHLFRFNGESSSLSLLSNVVTGVRWKVQKGHFHAKPGNFCRCFLLRKYFTFIAS
jgi:hypothetical protein